MVTVCKSEENLVRKGENAGYKLYLLKQNPDFNDPEEEPFWKPCGESKKMLITSILSFWAFLKCFQPFQIHSR